MNSDMVTWIKQFIDLSARVFLYFAEIFLRSLWRHRFIISYGVAMFLLGAWSAGGFSDKTANPYAVQTAEVEQAEDTEATGTEIASIEEPAQEQITEPAQKNAILSIFTGDKEEVAKTYSVDLVVGKGDTFLNMLVETGVGWNDAYEVSNALKGVYNLRSLKLGQKMKVVFEELSGGEHRFQALKIEKPETIINVARKDNGTFSASEEEKTFITKDVRSGGVIENSLFQLAAEMGIPASVIMEAINAYSYDVDFQRDIKGGNKFEVLYEVLYDESGRRVRSGDLKYALLTVGDKDLKVFRFTNNEGEGGFYTEDGRTIRRALLKTPINGARISSRYGVRKHPVLGYSKMHKGIDFAAPRGTPVYAAGNGTIEKIGRYGAYGNYVKIRHNSNYATAYAHLNGYAKGMKKGRKVKQGQVIAYVGTTGRSTGPHLHYETIVNGVQKNPLGLKMTPGKKLSVAELKKFEKEKADLETLLASLPLEKEVASNE